MSELPKIITALHVSEKIVGETRRLFEPFRANSVEGCVLWYGEVLADGVCTVVEAIRPEQQNRPQNYAISAEAMRAVRRLVRPRNLLLLTQIHSHPQSAYFSEWDAVSALNKQQGALNLVIPNFANVNWADLTKFCMVECNRDGDWIEWLAADWQRLRVIGGAGSSP